jgi:hypothetical protein
MFNLSFAEFRSIFLNNLRCKPTGEIFVKSGRDYWIACKKSDLREVYVIVCQKNSNLTLIDGNLLLIQFSLNYFG